MKVNWGLILAVIFAASVSTARGQSAVVTPATAEGILSAIRESPARVTVVNMWATWCGPCIEEFPDFVRLGKEYAGRGVAVIFVSTDFREERPSAEAFIRKQGWTTETYAMDEPDDAFINAFSREWSGAVPATFIYDESGDLSTFWEGKASYDELVDRISPILTPAAGR